MAAQGTPYPLRMVKGSDRVDFTQWNSAAIAPCRPPARSLTSASWNTSKYGAARVSQAAEACLTTVLRRCCVTAIWLYLALSGDGCVLAADPVTGLPAARLSRWEEMPSYLARAASIGYQGSRVRLTVATQ